TNDCNYTTTSGTTHTLNGTAVKNYAGVTPAVPGTKGGNTQVARSTPESGSSPSLMGSVVAGTTSSPDFGNGTDYTGNNNFIGRASTYKATGNRKLMLLQNQCLNTTSHGVGASSASVSLTSVATAGGKTVLTETDTVTAKATSWSVNSLDCET